MISAVVVVKNGEKTLDRALKSLKFADEIVVVDMASTDETVKIASKYTSQIFAHPDVGYADPARTFAYSKAKHEWIFSLDSDEELPLSAAAHIKQLVASENTADVYFFPRKNIIFDKWVKKTGWWPDYQPRLFKKGHAVWQVGVHRMPDVKGKAEYLPPKDSSAIIHHNYQHVEQYINRMNKYTSLQAQESFDDPQKPTEISSQSLLEEFFSDFLRRYFAMQGIEDGIHGTSLSLLQANYQLVKQLKEWELAGFSPDSSKPELNIQTIRKFQRDLNYWIADYYLAKSSGLVKIFWRVKKKLKI